MSGNLKAQHFVSMYSIRVVCLGGNDNSGWYFSSVGLLVLINTALACAVLKDCECTLTGFLIL